MMDGNGKNGFDDLFLAPAHVPKAVDVGLLHLARSPCKLVGKTEQLHYSWFRWGIEVVDRELARQGFVHAHSSQDFHIYRKAIARKIKSADYERHLLFKGFRQGSLCHGMSQKIHRVFKQLRIASERDKILGMKSQLSRRKL